MIITSKTYCVFVLTISFLIGLYPSYAQEQVDNSIQSVKQNVEPKTGPKELKRVQEIGGEVIVDGSLRVFEPIMGKVFDLVEVSTPVTPATNHARIFLTPGAGTKQQVSIIFDDGTTAKITNN